MQKSNKKGVGIFEPKSVVPHSDTKGGEILTRPPTRLFIVSLPSYYDFVKLYLHRHPVMKVSSGYTNKKLASVQRQNVREKKIRSQTR